MEPENVLKGQMAKSIVKELLKRCKNRVYHFGNTAFFEQLTQSEKSINREGEIGKKISSIPDFLVVTKKDKVLFLEVKFRTDPEALEEELLLEKEFLERFWEAKIILVTCKEKPYFRILTPPYFSKEKREGWPIPVLNWLPVEDDPELKVNSKVVKEFEKLIEKYYL
ncbi:hypothetical protein J7J39_03390 [bacterium]|nr:hypothetical protein [bacterium]